MSLYSMSHVSIFYTMNHVSFEIMHACLGMRGLLVSLRPGFDMYVCICVCTDAYVCMCVCICAMHDMYVCICM